MKTLWIFGTFFLTTVIFYNEIVVYFRHYVAWPEIEKAPILKILFVADPQIIGNKDQNNAFVTWIAKWDSDRYLYKTFSWATYAYSPDIVVFLGLYFINCHLPISVQLAVIAMVYANTIHSTPQIFNAL